MPFVLAPPNAVLGTIGIGNLPDRKLPCLYARELNQSITILATFKSEAAAERFGKWLTDCAQPSTQMTLDPIPEGCGTQLEDCSD